jgi:ketosteroid isomerase-like protein
MEPMHSGSSTDGLMSLYDPEAIFVPRPGETVAGAEGIREVLNGFLQLAETFTLEHGNQSDGLALLLDDWTLEGRDPAGNSIQMADRTAGVARRQADEGWRIVIDNPWGSARS